MCTVTYIPGEKSFLLASNRDENRNRPASLPPAIHLVHGQRLLFPRDGLAGGTWVAAGANGWSVVLLNGAFEKHFPRPSYRLSRGLILLDLLTTSNPGTAFTPAFLKDIEPFTVVLAGYDRLRVGRWNGVTAFWEEADPTIAHIWSSVTLYPAAIRAKREKWFMEWLQGHPFPAVKDVTDFHQFTGDGDPENDLRMERSNGIFTNSISVLECSVVGVQFDYLDLRNDARYSCSLSFVTTSPSGR